jgi:hypothetical protein
MVQAEWKFLTQINLSNNKITACGVKKLGKCKLKYIISVSLGSNPLKNAGIK